MKKRISTIITVIVFVTGLSLLLYPTVSNYWNSLHQTKAVANYSDAMEKMDKQKKELEATLPEETTVETINDGEALKVTFDSGILFATNSSTLSDASKSALRNLATSLNQNPGTDIKIVGHTDNTGNVDYNQTLSEKRAKSVFDYLMVDQGVSSKRMTYEGKGIHEPVADNSTVEGRALNRRVEILILPSLQMIQEAQNGTLK